MLLSPELELLLEADEPVVEPDFLELLLPELLPSVEELDFAFDVADLEPDDEALVLLPLDEVEEVGVLLALPILDELVLPRSVEPVLPEPDDPELPLEDEPDVLPEF